MKTRQVALVCMFVISSVVTMGVCHAGLEIDLQYAYEVGATTTTHVSAIIEKVEMGQGVPLAVTGQAEVDLTLEITDVDDEGTAVIKATFAEADASLMGEKQDAMPPGPITLWVDRKGQVLDIQTQNGPEVDLFAGGGVPLQLVVLLAGVVELPAEPIAVADEWVLDRTQEIPDMGEVHTLVTSHLSSIDATETVVLTDINASFPNFTTTNPLQDNEVTVCNGVLTVEQMERCVDAQTGLIRAADARMKFDGFAAIGEFTQLPLTMISTFTIESLDGPQEDQAAGE